jgi:hypothetical protein
MKRIEMRGYVVLDRGDFYEVENASGTFYIPFDGEAGQTNPSRVLVDAFGIGEIDSGAMEPDRYDAVFFNLKDAKKALADRPVQERPKEADGGLCQRCDTRLATENGLCPPCSGILVTVKGATEEP